MIHLSDNSAFGSQIISRVAINIIFLTKANMTVKQKQTDCSCYLATEYLAYITKAGPGLKINLDKLDSCW